MRLIGHITVFYWIHFSQLHYGNALPVKTRLLGSDYKEIMPSVKEVIANASALIPTLPGNMLPIQTQLVNSDSERVSSSQGEDQANATDASAVSKSDAKSANYSVKALAVTTFLSRNLPVVSESLEKTAGANDSELPPRKQPQKPTNDSQSEPSAKASGLLSAKRPQKSSKAAPTETTAEMLESSSANPQKPSKAKTTQGYNKAKTTQGYNKAKTTQDDSKAQTTQDYRKAKTTQGYSKAKTTQGYNKAKTTQGYSTAKPAGQMAGVFRSSSKRQKPSNVSLSEKMSKTVKPPSAKQSRDSSNASPTVSSFLPENEMDKLGLSTRSQAGETSDVAETPTKFSTPATPSVTTGISKQTQSTLVNGSSPGSDNRLLEVYSSQWPPPVNRSTLTRADVARNRSISDVKVLQVADEAQVIMIIS